MPSNSPARVALRDMEQPDSGRQPLGAEAVPISRAILGLVRGAGDLGALGVRLVRRRAIRPVRTRGMASVNPESLAEGDKVQASIGGNPRYEEQPIGVVTAITSDMVTFLAEGEYDMSYGPGDDDYYTAYEEPNAPPPKGARLQRNIRCLVVDT